VQLNNNLTTNVDISKFVNYLILLYAFTIPFSRGVNKTIAFVLLFFWLLEGTLKSKFLESLNNRTIFAFLLFIFYSYISILWSEHTKEALYYANRYIYYFSIIVIFTSLKKEFIPKVIISFLLAMLPSETITYGIYFEFWTTTFNESYHAPFPTAFMGHTAYSVFLSLTALLTVNKILLTNKAISLENLFYTVLFLFTFGNLIISGGRTGLLIFFIAIIVIGLYSHKRELKKVGLFFLGIALLSLFSYKNIEIFQDRVDSASDDIEKLFYAKSFDSSWGTGVGLIYLGAKIAKDNPFFGVGIKDNADVKVEYAKNDDLEGIEYFVKHIKDAHFHNEYIEILTSIGLIGLVLFLYFLYSLINIRIKSVEYETIKIAFFIVLVLSITTSALFHQRHNIALFALFIGILLTKSKFELEEEKNEI